MSEHIYELKMPFDYGVKGEVKQASFITLFAPTFNQIDKVTPIKQAFTAAISEIADLTVSGTDAEPTNEAEAVSPEQVMQVMYRWSGDMTKVLLHAEQLFKSGSALVDGEEKLTTPLMEKMTLEDFEGLVGSYVANFIAPSLMGGQ